VKLLSPETIGVLYKSQTSRKLAHGAHPSAVYVWYAESSKTSLFSHDRPQGYVSRQRRADEFAVFILLALAALAGVDQREPSSTGRYFQVSVMIPATIVDDKMAHCRFVPSCAPPQPRASVLPCHERLESML
jgi:hypothetical protein